LFVDSAVTLTIFHKTNAVIGASFGVQPASTGASFMENTHLSALAAKHAGIERRLADESRRPLPDSVLVSALKKQKLRLKEALSLA
jgi:hypothetical protein